MLSSPSAEEIYHGQAIYSKSSLAIYDLFVTRFSNRFVWCCTREQQIEFFKQHISRNHLDIGVGTGGLLQHLELQPENQRLGLLDLNENCLMYAKNRLRYLNPEIYKHDVFQAFTDITKKFDTVSLNYVLHCLPGSLSQKAVVFDHIKAVLQPKGCLFGSTILGKSPQKNWLAKKLLALYNQKKIMHNLADDETELRQELNKRFSAVKIVNQGCVAMFVAYR